MNNSKPIAIIKTGSTYPQISNHYGDFEQWIASGLATAAPVWVVDVSQGDHLPEASALAGLVITGSHAMVTDQADWMTTLSHWLYRAIHQLPTLPVLGLCFGHQLLAQTLGGEVADNPVGIEVGTVPLRLTQAGHQDALLSAIENHPWAQVVHRQSVLTPPPGATVLASNVHDACQAFRYGECVWGVQFHPEFSADVMRAYLQALSGDSLSQEQVDTYLQDVRECDDASSILAGFARLILPQVA
ncbi:glutamine amidotransferase [Alcanivorax nanhaiticus]|uniref:Glutamine amidotransferase n=1 Tax=Alcanivorax nanhaiticus TaxID=1177154 RepID=A0A095SHN7_9GAMM|nr:glutamine amidotransferase [Alcanivorax nanhaiticus]KGD64116.1 glutamine amidotransferase [Alcanivorax nanhaiticus]